MTEDVRVLHLLDQVLGELPKTAPDRLLSSVLDGVRATSQRRGRWPSIRPRGMVGGPNRRVLSGALLVATVAVLAIVFTQLAPRPGIVGPGATDTASPLPSSSPPSPTVSPRPSATTSAGDPFGTAITLEDVGSDGLVSGFTYTSNRFEPQVTFKLTDHGSLHQPGQDTAWCSALSTFGSPTLEERLPYTSKRSIVLGFRASCLNHLRLIRPYAVDCGTPDPHPDAATLAAAILAKPGMATALDLGTLLSEGSTVPAGLFRHAYPSRVLELDQGGRIFDAKANDPDHCRLLPEPNSAEPTIEIRGDMAGLMILMDVAGELVILRTEAGGYDAPTGAAARAHGIDLETDLPNMLKGIYDIDFASTIRSASPGPAAVLEDMGSEGLVADITYTSSRFMPPVTFSLPKWETYFGAGDTDWCSPRHSDAPVPHTSARTIVLAYRSGCVSDLRIIRPYAVDCGTPDAHPDATTLAAAILGRPGMTLAQDRGTLETVGAVPANLVRGATSGRVIRIDSGPSFDDSATDPDHCRLLLEPGSGDPTIEVRHDMAALLVLLDVHGELIVLRVADGGYDSASGRAAHSRGYGVGSSTELLEAMLGQIHDLQFK